MTSYRISVMDEHLQSNKDDPSGGDWEMVKWLYRLETNNYDWSISGPIISASGEETLSLLFNLEQLLWEQPWGRKMGRKRGRKSCLCAAPLQPAQPGGRHRTSLHSAGKLCRQRRHVKICTLARVCTHRLPNTISILTVGWEKGREGKKKKKEKKPHK